MISREDTIVATAVQRETPASSIDAVLRGGLDELTARSDRGEKLVLSDVFAVFASLGERANAFVVLLVAAPFIWPLSLGPIATPASLLMAILGWQLTRDHASAPASDAPTTPRRGWFSQRITSVRYWTLRSPLPRQLFRFMRYYLEWMLWLKNGVLRARHWMLGPSRPRQSSGGEARARRACGWAIIIGAILVGVPIPLLPLTNTFPAAGIVLVTLGWLERDGVLILLGWINYLIGVLLFAALALAIIWFGYEVVAEWIPDLWTWITG